MAVDCETAENDEDDMDWEPTKNEPPALSRYHTKYFETTESLEPRKVRIDLFREARPFRLLQAQLTIECEVIPIPVQMFALDNLTSFDAVLFKDMLVFLDVFSRLERAWIFRRTNTFQPKILGKAWPSVAHLRRLVLVRDVEQLTISSFLGV